MTQTATPLIGLGGSLKIGTQGASPTYVAIAGIKSIDLPDGKFGTEEVTTLGQTSLQRKYLKTLEEAGEVKVELFWESADPGQAALIAAYATGSNTTYGADYPFEGFLPVDTAGGQTTTGDEFAFNGIVIGFTRPKLQPDKTVTWSVDIKVDGGVTITEGS